MKARTLLDPSFTTRMTPVLLPWIYLLLVGALGMAAVVLVVGAFVVAWWMGLIALVVVPAGATVVFALLRVACEMIMDFSRLPHVAQTMADGLVRMESAVDDVAEDMPRIAFLRGSRRRDVGQPPSTPQTPPETLEA